MKQKRNYFVLNKESDFLRGRSRGVAPGTEGLSLLEGSREGSYYTRVFDSREKQTVWHRLTVEGHLDGVSTVEVTVFASESSTLMADGTAVPIDELIHDDKISEGQKDSRMEPFKRAVFYYPKDVLLHRIQGRYLWLKISFSAQRGLSPSISRIQVYFPKDTWMKYLPEVYERDRESASFLERYLNIFQTVYEDMTKRIEDAPALFEPWTAARAPLLWMAQWLSVENLNLWNEAQLRYLTANAVRLYQYRGTVRYLKEILKLYTGREPYIIERHQLEPYFDKSPAAADLKRLYSSGTYEFTVLLDAEGVEANNRAGILRQLVEMAKPANMECKIVPLKPYIFLGQYSYLGINSVLGQYRAFQLDGLCAVPFSAVAEE